MSSHAQYKYGKLSAHHIRILKVINDGNTFRGELESFHIDSLPYFLALSWTWPKANYGDDMGNKAFVCDGSLFTVSACLHSALSNLTPQGTSSSLRIWIDAICIDQGDTAEKSIQVPLMCTIYGRASRVVVWLGEAADDSAMIMKDGRIDSILNGIASITGYAPLDQLQELGLPHRSDDVWLAIGHLLHRRWFNRLWIVQEVVLARGLDVLCGHQLVAWDRLVKLGAEIHRAGLDGLCYTEETSFNGRSVLAELSRFRTWGRIRRLDIAVILNLSRYRDVEKPVDRVYGFLALVNDHVRQSITVDCAQNEREFWRPYLQFGRYAIMKDIHHTILERASSVNRPVELPTWCPNLNSPYPEESTLSKGPVFNAGWSLWDPAEYNVKFVPDSNNIEIPGFRIDRIKAFVNLGQPFRLDSPETEQGPDGTIAQWLTREEQCFAMACSVSNRPEVALENHVRNLIRDSWKGESPALHSDWPTIMQAYQDTLNFFRAVGTGSTMEGTTVRQEACSAFIDEALSRCCHRPYFVTEHGRLGLGPLNMKEGDDICIFYSGNHAFVLRYGNRSNVASLVGDAYLDGCMHLETMPSEGRGPNEVFTIG